MRAETRKDKQFSGIQVLSAYIFLSAIKHNKQLKNINYW